MAGVSRAVRALDEKRFRSRVASPDDRRSERLTLHPAGQEVFWHLARAAQNHATALEERLGKRDAGKRRAQPRGWAKRDPRNGGGPMPKTCGAGRLAHILISNSGCSSAGKDAPPRCIHRIANLDQPRASGFEAI